MKHKGMLALTLVLALSVSALTTFASASSADESNAAAAVQADQKGQRHGRHGSRQEVAEPENAIGKDAAKAKALADAGVTEEQAGKVKARVTQLEDGTIVYKVTFVYDGQRYAYQINATTGEVVDNGSKAVSEEDDANSRRHDRHGEKVAEPENAIGKDAAKAKALADAGVTEEQAGKVKARVTQLEDGTIVYKVTFIYDGQRYAYQINATTGAVVDKSIETASDRAASSDRGIEDGARMETSAAEATSASA